MKDRRLLLYIALAAMLALVPVGAAHILWPHFIWQNEPLHSTLETVGALAAILLAIVLLQRQPDEGNKRLFWVAVGLLGAGILHSFHAASQSGQQFVLLYSVAVFVGGFGFALVWLPESSHRKWMRKWTPWVVVVGSTLFGIWTFLFRGPLPVMIQDGQFTSTATVLNFLGGAFFLSAAGRFFLDFHRSGNVEAYRFCGLALLFGIASLIFPFSTLWDDAWWFWHGVRLLGYLLAMGFVVNEYLTTSLSLRTEVTQHKQAEERLAHVSSVLRAVRNVNQLITHEKDREHLIQKSCDLMVEARGFDKAWILLLHEDGRFASFAAAGLGEESRPFLNQLKSGNYPTCVRELMAQDSPLLSYDRPGREHKECILAESHSTRGVIRGKLEHEGKVYGMIGVSLRSQMITDQEEQGLFRELCGDISYALAGIEMEEKRQQAEEALRKSEEKYRNLVENAQVGIYKSNLKGDILYVNEAMVKILGFSTREEVMSPGVLARYRNPKDREIWIAKLKEHGVVPAYEVDLLSKTGEVINVVLSAVLDADGISGMVLDITERKRAEEALRTSEERFRNLADLLPQSVYEADTKGMLTYANRHGMELFGYTAEDIAKGFNVLQAIAPQDRARAAENMGQTLANSTVITAEFIAITKDGRTFPISSYSSTIMQNNAVLGVCGIIVDTSEQKKAEAENQRLKEKAEIASRLAAIGEMAAGVAHEINNPLTGVIGFSQLLMERPDLPEDIQADLKTIAEGSQRVAEIVRRLLTFARQNKPIRTSVNLNELIGNTLELRSYVLKTANIEVVTRLDPDLPWTVVDPGQLQQVFLNLIVNAEYAMKTAHGKGTLTITTEKHGHHVRIAFHDDGPGIAKENITHIFEPFFTTKGPGEGTGLGLSLSHSIVLEHEGEMHVESEPGQGAAFIIELPTAGDLHPPQPEAQTTPQPEAKSKKKARILVVDDEPHIRGFIHDALTPAGHSVDVTGNPQEALDKIGRTDYNAIFIDIRMPGMSGLELHKRILEKAPSLAKRIVFMTGDTSDADVRRYLTQNKLLYLAKPFDLQTLEQKINAILESNEQPS